MYMFVCVPVCIEEGGVGGLGWCVYVCVCHVRVYVRVCPTGNDTE